MDVLLDARAREQAVVEREDREQQHVDRDRAERTGTLAGRVREAYEVAVEKPDERRGEENGSSPGERECRDVELAHRAFCVNGFRNRGLRRATVEWRIDTRAAGRAATIIGGMTVAITGIGVVSPYGVGRERFWQHVQPRLQRNARDHRLRRLRVRLHRGRAGSARVDRRRASTIEERAPQGPRRTAPAGPIRGATRGRR